LALFAAACGSASDGNTAPPTDDVEESTDDEKTIEELKMDALAAIKGAQAAEVAAATALADAKTAVANAGEILAGLDLAAAASGALTKEIADLEHTQDVAAEALARAAAARNAAATAEMLDIEDLAETAIAAEEALSMAKESVTSDWIDQLETAEARLEQAENEQAEADAALTTAQARLDENPNDIRQSDVDAAEGLKADADSELESARAALATLNIDFETALDEATGQQRENAEVARAALEEALSQAEEARDQATQALESDVDESSFVRESVELAALCGLLGIQGETPDRLNLESESLNVGADSIRAAVELCRAVPDTTGIFLESCGPGFVAPSITIDGSLRDDRLPDGRSVLMFGHMMVRLHPADTLTPGGQGFTPPSSAGEPDDTLIVVIDSVEHGDHAAGIGATMLGTQPFRVELGLVGARYEKLKDDIRTTLEGTDDGVRVLFINIPTISFGQQLIASEADVVLALDALGESVGGSGRNVVVNMSFGGYNCATPPPLLSKAMSGLAGISGEDATTNGQVEFIVSAGNDEDTGIVWPAHFGGNDLVHTIGSIEEPAADSPEYRSCFSNSGPSVQYWMVGEEVVFGNATWSGTSFAAPQAAALLASSELAPTGTPSVRPDPNDTNASTLVTYRLVEDKGAEQVVVLRDKFGNEVHAQSTCDPNGEYFTNPAIWQSCDAVGEKDPPCDLP